MLNLTQIKMYLYHIISWIKFFLGIVILIITYTSINVYEDPVIGIGLSFLGIFIAARWISFYIFLRIQKIYRHLDHFTLVKESYKLSLLFGIYMVINYLLIVGGRRNKYFWILLLGWFIWMQISLFSEKKSEKHEKS